MFDFKRINSDKYKEESLLEINSLSSKEIVEQLEKLSEKVKNDEVFIYPFRSILVEDGKRKVVVQEIKEEDATVLMNQIVGRFCSYIMKEAYRLSERSDDELREFCSWLTYLNKNALDEERDLALEKFDDTFSFLEEIPIYASIYRGFRQNYFSLLRGRIEVIISDRKIKKMRLQEDSINRTYSKRIKKEFRCYN